MKCYKAGDFSPVADNIFTANILRRSRALPPYWGCSSLVYRYQNTDVWTFLKLMVMIQHVKMVQILCHDICSKLLSGQVLHTRNSSHFFWNLKDPVLVRTLPYRRKQLTTHYWLAFFLNWFQYMMLDIICCIYV